MPRVSHVLEAALVRGVSGAVRRMDWRRSLGVGERLGDLVGTLGIRRRVAEDNLQRCVPGWSESERHAILREHYRELGRVAVEYARLPELARAAPGEVVAEVRGDEHLVSSLARGRGVVVVTGHFGNFELAGAVMAQRHPLHFVVKPQGNPEVDRWVVARRRATGVGVIPMQHLRRILDALRDNQVVAMLADQDAGPRGRFVPFLGRPASTAAGPARVAIAAGAPLVTAFTHRGADGRHTVVMEEPIETAGATVDDLTRRHVERLERWVRLRPASWLWLHRRWKTPPPAPFDWAPAAGERAASAGPALGAGH